MREGTGGLATLGVAAASGALAAVAPPAPTGRPVVDAVLVAVSVAVVTFVGAAAPWWLSVVVCGVAVAAGAAAAVVALAAAGLVIGLVLAARHIDSAPTRAAVVGIGLHALCWAALPGFFGLTAIIGVSTAVVVLVVGFSRSTRPVRRGLLAGLGVAAVVGVVGLVALGLGARAAVDDLSDGRRAAEAGIDALQEGELAAAADHFEVAAVAFGAGRGRVRSPLVGLAGFVPVVAQHRTALNDLSGEGATASAEVAAALRQIDPSALRLQRGRVDVAAVAALAEPLGRVRVALGDMRAAIENAGSPWLVDAVTDRLDGLEGELIEREPQLIDAVRAAELAPQLLGGEGARRYLVLFTTPSEARGIGGFVGNYAQLDISDGRITMPRFGRVRDLEALDQEVGTVISGPAEFLERYRDFCCRGSSDGRVGDAAWRNLTATPHFPWVGEIAVEMYRQETGVDIDGVMLIDPYVVAALLAYTGPVELPSVGVTIDGDNAAQFLLRDQYQFTGDANSERIDALEEAAQGTFLRVLGGDLPDPVQLVQDLGPLVEQRRFLVWTTDEAERDLLGRVGLLGDMPARGGGDGWSVALNNAGGGKIDIFLERAASYVSTTGADGVTTATLRLHLTNNAPSSGLPDYVIGNLVGLPRGTSRLYVSVYTPLEVASATVGGEALALRRGTEAGWGVYSGYVEIPSGATAEIEMRLVGEVAEPDRLTTWDQPLIGELQPID